MGPRGTKFDPRWLLFGPPGIDLSPFPPASPFRTQVKPYCAYMLLDIVFRSLLAARAFRNLHGSDVSRIVRPRVGYRLDTTWRPKTRQEDPNMVSIQFPNSPRPERLPKADLALQLPTVFRTRSRHFTPGGPFWILGRRFLHVSLYLARRNARSD